MENAVFNELDKLIEKRDDICKCEKCRLDIVAIALNELPTKYVVSEMGELYTKANQMEVQCDADIIKEIIKAIDIVSNATKHDD